MPHTPLNRRRFLENSLLTAGMAAAARSPLTAALPQTRAPFGETVVQTPFARLEKLGEGIWAVVSTPFKPDGTFGDMTTVCNGGVIAGSDGVLVVDTFQRPRGAAWVAEQVRALTGRAVTHVAITHFHADHSGGNHRQQDFEGKPELFIQFELE